MTDIPEGNYVQRTEYLEATNTAPFAYADGVTIIPDVDEEIFALAFHQSDPLAYLHEEKKFRTIISSKVLVPRETAVALVESLLRVLKTDATDDEETEASE